VVQAVQRAAVTRTLQEQVPQAVELRSTQLPVLLEHRVLASLVEVRLQLAPTVTGTQPVVVVEFLDQEPAR
jgi:hypothetical protein